MSIPFGQKIQSKVAETLYKGYPDSERTITLPAGKTTPVINSFIRGEWYEFETDEGNLYLKQNRVNQSVVHPDTVDMNIPGTGLFYGITDWFKDKKTDVEKNAGFVKEGFEKSISDIGLNFELFGKQTKWVILITIPAGVLLWVYLTAKK